MKFLFYKKTHRETHGMAQAAPEAEVVLLYVAAGVGAQVGTHARLCN